MNWEMKIFYHCPIVVQGAKKESGIRMVVFCSLPDRFLMEPRSLFALDAANPHGLCVVSILLPIADTPTDSRAVENLFYLYG